MSLHLLHQKDEMITLCLLQPTNDGKKGLRKLQPGIQNEYEVGP